MDDPLANRLLQWSRVDRFYLTHSQYAVGLVHLTSTHKFKWFVFVCGLLCCRGERDTLHSALAHVEGNFVGRQLLDRDDTDPVEEVDGALACAAE